MQPLNIRKKPHNRRVLIFQDGFLGFVKILSAAQPNHYVKADGVIEWYKRFGVPETRSDQGFTPRREFSKTSTAPYRQSNAWSLHNVFGLTEQLKLSPGIYHASMNYQITAFRNLKTAERLQL
jgi:hypothetical protein